MIKMNILTTLLSLTLLFTLTHASSQGTYVSREESMTN